MKTKNRWLIALSAISIHISIGSIYAYSVFNNPLSEQFGWETTQVALTFTLAIFFLGISAAFFGKFVEKYGPRRSAIVAAILFAGGLALIFPGIWTDLIGIVAIVLIWFIQQPRKDDGDSMSKKVAANMS